MIGVSFKEKVDRRFMKIEEIDQIGGSKPKGRHLLGRIRVYFRKRKERSEANRNTEKRIVQIEEKGERERIASPSSISIDG